MKIKMEVEFETCDYLILEDDKEEVDWLFNDLLLRKGQVINDNNQLFLHSNEIADVIGTLRVLKIKKVK